MNAVIYIMARIREEVEKECSWEDAARRVLVAHPDLCIEVMDRIGNWPASEIELFALQRVYK